MFFATSPRPVFNFRCFHNKAADFTKHLSLWWWQDNDSWKTNSVFPTCFLECLADTEAAAMQLLKGEFSRRWPIQWGTVSAPNQEGQGPFPTIPLEFLHVSNLYLFDCLNSLRRTEGKKEGWRDGNISSNVLAPNDVTWSKLCGKGEKSRGNGVWV